MIITAEQRAILDAPIPREHVETREQGGATLSYIAGWRVIATLNRAFPDGSWCYDATDTREIAREQDDRKRWVVSYACRCRLTIQRRTREVTYSGETACDRLESLQICDVGHGHGIDRRLGVAIESAEKEAATDALKRCAKSLGMQVGLALYDKAQEHVEESAAPPSSAPDPLLTKLVAEWPVLPEAGKRAVWGTLNEQQKTWLRSNVRKA